MFIGTSYPKLDDKFRLILPAKFRDRLAGGVILTKGQEHCVNIMPSAEYLAKAAAITEGMVVGTPNRRNLSRHFFGMASEQVPDGQGRILLAPELREWAELGKDLVVAGVGRHVEIWNPKIFAELMAAGAQDFANYTDGEVNLN